MIVKVYSQYGYIGKYEGGRVPRVREVVAIDGQSATVTNILAGGTFHPEVSVVLGDTSQLELRKVNQ